MQISRLALVGLISAAASPYAVSATRGVPILAHRVDTVYVREAPASLDYDELARRVAVRLKPQQSENPTVIDGDLIVKGRIGVGGAPEPGTDYGITIRAPISSGLRLISNEALKDPQRAANQHRHVGTLSLAQDGGLRLDVNSTCFTDSRGCTTEDKARRRAFTGYDSMGDYAWYLSNVDSLTGVTDAPRAQSLVFRLIGDDGHIHLTAFRATQKIFFNGSTATNAADLQWEVPLAPIVPPAQ
ncbi:MAG TPA: hypothetical protein VF042_11945 [Gemmatimonadaceae bacterium]